jgi:hypothetical protein
LYGQPGLQGSYWESNTGFTLRPAIVTEVARPGDLDSEVDLTIFAPLMVTGAYRVRFSPTPAKGHWSWRAAVDSPLLLNARRGVNPPMTTSDTEQEQNRPLDAGLIRAES